MNSPDILTAFAIVLLAAAVHASFQLSVSVLTLLSGHALGRKTARRRLMNLVGGFILGSAAMTILIVSFAAYAFGALLPPVTPLILWATSTGLAVGVGLSVWLFYYRRGEGTSLWIPRGFARYLDNRSRATKNVAESFGLGLTSVAAELLFIIASIVITALTLIRLTPEWQLVGVLLYGGVSLLPLLIVGLLIGAGHKLSRIQKWRETNKRFLQFIAGGGLIVLGAYIYVERVITSSVTAGGLS